MVSVEEVFEKIKKMSKKTYNTQHRILLTDIAVELNTSPDKLLLHLVELEDAGFVSVHNTKVVSVSLTKYGLSQDEL